MIVQYRIKCPRCFQESIYDFDIEVEKPVTNADRIRAMTDEELAKWFTSVCTAKSTCSCMDCAFDAFMDCGFLDWLKQEATNEQ